MKKSALVLLSAVATTSLFAALDPKEEVRAAVARLAEKPNYAWVTTTKNNAPPPQNQNAEEPQGRARFAQSQQNPIEAKTVRGGITQLTSRGGDDTIVQVATKGDKAIMKTKEGWKPLEDFRGGFRPPPGDQAQVPGQAFGGQRGQRGQAARQREVSQLIASEIDRREFSQIGGQAEAVEMIPLKKEAHQICHSGGQQETEKLITLEAESKQTFHAGGQGHVGEDIIVDVQRFECGETRRQVEVRESGIATDNKAGEIRKTDGNRNIGEPIKAEVEEGQTAQVRRQAETGEQIVGQVKARQFQ